MKKFLVIGNPIEHSLSPKLHNFWIKQNNINAIYEKQKSELYINIILLIVSLGLIFYFDDFIKFLNVYSFASSLCYLSFLLYYYKLSKYG